MIVIKEEKSVIAGNMMIKKFFEDITGITAAREARQKEKEAEEQKRLELIEKANAALIKKEKAEAQKKARAEKRRLKVETILSPKELATKKGEPWVDVIGFQTTKENVRHGFFELDWNDEFIVQLKLSGYGFDGDPDEDIVGRWFRDICNNAAAAEGIDMSNRDTGYINVRKLNDGRSEVG